MRICRLNRIKIKDPEKWDKAKYDDFVGNRVGTTETENAGSLFKKRRSKSRTKSGWATA
jgi:1-phosphatidylinositol-4-phosphate 5-kinase